MFKKTVLAIRRDDRFSPNSVDKDTAILKAVVDGLSKLGLNIPIVDEENFDSSYNADVIISMARNPRVLDLLKTKENEGIVVVNSAYGVEACSRSHVLQVMGEQGFALPPQTSNCGYWLKRGDLAAQSHDDVVFCKDEKELQEAKEKFYNQGIKNFVVSGHIVGDLVKFYGVANGFFRYYYPTDDHISKFGDEIHNGQAHHYSFYKSKLQSEMTRLSRILKVDVYGGDVIIDEKGRFYLIDFNDWPSFSRCCDDAAKAIIRCIKKK